MKQWQDKMTREMELRNLAPRTKEAYLRDAGRLFSFHKDKDPKDIGIEEIKDFLQFFSKNPCLGKLTLPSPSSFNRVGTAIKFYYYHVLNRDYSKVMPRRSVPKTIPMVLSQDEVKRMINSTYSVFYKAFLMTLYSTGMRSREIRYLKAEDIDSNRMVIYIKNGKGNKDRQASLSPTLLAALRTYWRLFRINNPNKSQYLFMATRNRHGSGFDRPMQSTSIAYIVRKTAEFAGVKKKFILTV